MESVGRRTMSEMVGGVFLSWAGLLRSILRLTIGENL